MCKLMKFIFKNSKAKKWQRCFFLTLKLIFQTTSNAFLCDEEKIDKFHVKSYFFFADTFFLFYLS
jgi:hypothetical protein